jgi:release factor glutamine methyltransferase
MRIDNLEISIGAGVYPPSEDTYLLLDSLELRTDDTFLDMGCGVGLASIVAANKVKRVVSADISRDAVRNTTLNLRKNKLSAKCSVIQTDLFSAFGKKALFSVIAFNPPYLAKRDDRTELDHAVVGGESGAEVTLRFIESATKHLRKNGRLYVVASSLSDVNRVTAIMKETGFEVTIADELPLFFERLYILKGILQKDPKETVL